MEIMKGKKGKAVSIPCGLGLSLLTNMSITTISIILIVILLNQNAITWENTGYWIMATLLISSFFGGKIAIASIKTQKYLIALMSGMLYWTLLLCITALFFGGQYSSVLETALLILSGAVTAALLHTPKKKLKNYKRFNC